MVDTFTSNLQLTNQTEGGNDNTWGVKCDDNFELIDDKLGDLTSISTTGGTTALTDDQQDVAAIKVSGTLVSNSEVEFDGRGGFWIVWNNTSGAFTVTVKVSGQTGVAVAQGTATLVWCDGTDIRAGVPTAEVVADTTPQLGGNLDANGFSILLDDNTGFKDHSGNETLILQKVASAINYIDVFNASIGTAPVLQAAGDDTNINLELRGKGTTGGVDAVFHNSGVKVKDSTDAHTMTVRSGENLSADRLLSFILNDANRVINLSGTLSVQGTATIPAGTALVQANNLSDVADKPTAFGNIKQAASDSATGVVEIAVQSEMEAAAANVVVTPERQHFHPAMPKASGSGAAAGGALGAGFNVASIARDSTGSYTVTMTSAMASTSYGVLISANDPADGDPICTAYDITSATVFKVYFKTRGAGAATDRDFTFAVFGEAA